MKKAPILIIAFLVTAAAGALWYYQGHAKAASAATNSQTYTEVVQVKQGNVSATFSVVGQLEAVQDADLAFEHMTSVAALQSLAVKAGSVVTTGQVLATIDATPYQAALDQAKSSLAAAEETLADLTTPATALELAQAGVSVAKAEQALEQAKAALADLTEPDLTSLKNAVLDAQDSLALLQLQTKAAEYDSLAKSERDLNV